MNDLQSFEQFLREFIPKIAAKTKELNEALWLLETTGSEEASELKTRLDAELRLLFSDPNTYGKLIAWEKSDSIKDPILRRQLNVLIRAFKQNQIPKSVLLEITKKESELLLTYANFRSTLDGKPVTENEIKEILKKEDNREKREKAWEASKEIGNKLAPQILSLVTLRNEGADSLGYSDFFQMQLDLQEVDETWLFGFLDQLEKKSNAAYDTALHYIEERQSKRFGVPIDQLGPWAWSEPFCQEDPIDTCELDSLVSNQNICDLSVSFYTKMGIDIQPTLNKSDMFERPGKNQHAFCINIDRNSDVRTLNNVKPTLKWFETVLHEFGHAIYELGYNNNLPWLLREPPHMITTEAMALIAGRRAYLSESLCGLMGNPRNILVSKAEQSLQRRQLIFSRWVLVMTYFERELYKDPEQDLNALWWSLVKRFQKIPIPKGRKGNNDWAAKYHVGLAPVYYYSYLLGEVFASSIEQELKKATGQKDLFSERSGQFLKERLFALGNSVPWFELIKKTTGDGLKADDWVTQFAK